MSESVCVCVCVCVCERGGGITYEEGYLGDVKLEEGCLLEKEFFISKLSH